jgi:hypothetical protein
MAPKAKKTAAAAIAALPVVPATPIKLAPAAPPAAIAEATSVATLSYAELAAFSRDNLAAAVKSNAALSAGCEAIGQEVMIFARNTMEHASEVARAWLGARTIEDVVRLQTDLVKHNFEGLVAGSTKLSELGATMTSEALAPWGGRIELALAHLAKPLAA